MTKYADVYGGKVREIRETNMNFTDWSSIWDPATYWIDVTGVEDIDVGYLVKFEATRGTYFEKPEESLPQEQTFEDKQNGKLEFLNHCFETASEEAYVDSSLGFRADANPTANRNIDGLITLYSNTPDEIIHFMDYDNMLQDVSLDDLKVLQKEVIENGNYVYAQKWTYRDQILSCTTEEELNALSFSFEYKNYDVVPTDDNTTAKE